MPIRRWMDARRLLLVGYGVRGRQWHQLARRRRDVEVAGVVDPDAGAAETARRLGLATWETIEDALANAAAAGAIVASPPREHAAQAIACLEAGLAVLVEKPLALSPDDARAVAKAAETSARPALAAQNFRFLPRERAIREVLASGAIGRPRAGVVVSARSTPPRRGHFAADDDGELWDICLHHLDALRTRFGSSPEAVDAATNGQRSLTATLSWTDGLRVTYHHTRNASAYEHFEWIEGDTAAAAIVDERVRVATGLQQRRVKPPRGPRPDSVVLSAFLAAIETGEPGELSAEDNVATIELVETVARSLSVPARPA